MNDRFLQYTTEYISGAMSLRTPQKTSLEILDDILARIELRKTLDLDNALNDINNHYPICTDFERDFMSLTFALATGVGKTRLMGAFITYLYTNKDIHNFFVVAPSMTIYNKLMKDLGDPSSSKYVFKGLGCFTNAPIVISEDAYKEMTGTFFQSDVRIFVFNIDKFNKDESNMRKVNEFLGSSFYKYVSELDDLVVLMDESHHYRADRGMDAINGLRPVLGLELTATPIVNKGSRQILFKNVVYEYPLSKAIEDGYTRTPYAVTRSDVQFYNFGDEEIDKMMLSDGIICHENAKKSLEEYAVNHSKPKVKPFMLVVCKDTDHATWVENYIKSDSFKNGYYRNRTIVVHSKQRGAESDENTRLLLKVEEPDNPIEIVIHVNMLKEGWDVNNLYTIVPLRTATSKILREQMVGRGLRLPYGERTGDTSVDSVMLTAHDKFDDILQEAQRGDSIFKAGNVIQIEDIVEDETTYTQLSLPTNTDSEVENGYEMTGLERSDSNDRLFELANQMIREQVATTIQDSANHTVSASDETRIAREVEEELRQDEDLAQRALDKWGELGQYLKQQTQAIHRQIVNHYIPIPKIKVTDAGVEEYEFVDFDIDLSEFSQVPVNNDILIQNLEDPRDLRRVHGEAIDFDGYNPGKIILECLKQKPEIDYERCSDHLRKHITDVCNHYLNRFGENGMRNIVMMYKINIADSIYNQMMKENHFYHTNGFIKEEVIGNRTYNYRQMYRYSEEVGLFDSFSQRITSVLFTGIRNGVFDVAKFQSGPELTFARVIENDNDVKNWLRPAPEEFNITYNHGKRYEPDFVVETDNEIFLVEVKGEDKLNDANVIAKKERAIQYCDAATRWGVANGYKSWKYLFIPSMQITPHSSFLHLAEQFKEL